MKNGRFIVFEGLDASGKTTQANNLIKRLHALGISGVYTKEPTESLPGGIARSALCKKTHLQNETLALLFIADRIEHITNDILPARALGRTVISDRYYISNIAYQGLEMDKKMLLKLNEMFIMDKLMPDMTIFLDIDPEESCARIAKERLRHDLYDEINKQTAIRNNFLEIFDLLKERERILTIRSEENADKTFEKIWLKVSRLFTDKTSGPI